MPQVGVDVGLRPGRRVCLPRVWRGPLAVTSRRHVTRPGAGWRNDELAVEPRGLSWAPWTSHSSAPCPHLPHLSNKYTRTNHVTSRINTHCPSLPQPLTQWLWGTSSLHILLRYWLNDCEVLLHTWLRYWHKDCEVLIHSWLRYWLKDCEVLIHSWLRYWLNDCEVLIHTYLTGVLTQGLWGTSTYLTDWGIDSMTVRYFYTPD